MKNIILASASPRRKKLLEQINFTFKVQPSFVDESYDKDLTPSQVVRQLARRKTISIAQNSGRALIIGADTIVVFKNEILEKPVNENEARDMLHSLSGETHQVLTGVSLCKVNQNHIITNSITFYEKTYVTFGDLNAQSIDDYVANGSPMDKAGAYGIQDDYGAVFVKHIEGDYYNVVGFPLHAFYHKMQSFAPEYLPGKAVK